MLSRLDVLESLIEFNRKNFSSEREVIEFILEKAVEVTFSKVGYFHFLAEDQETIELYTWSKNTYSKCQAPFEKHNNLSQAGIWADCARQKKIVIHNDYKKHSSKKSLPEGHFPIIRHMSVPVLDENQKVRIISGVGNKDTDYTQEDSLYFQLFMNEAWKILQAQRANVISVQTQKEYKNLQEQLVHKEKLAILGTLASGIVHEISNPLMVIQLQISNILEQAGKDNPLPVYVTEALNSQSKAVERVRNILSNLRKFSRSEKLGTNEKLNIHEIINDTLSFYGLMFKNLPITLELKLEAKDPLVYANSSSIQQIVINLISNAKDAIMSKISESESGSQIEHKIIISTEDDAGFVKVKIIDDGCGIPPGILTKVFDPFFTTKNAAKGTGLGLSICNTLLQDMNGSFQVNSKVGAGSVFSFKIPRQGARSHEEMADIYKHVPKCLVVDDEMDFRFILRQKLKKLGIDSEASANAEEAIKKFEQNKYDYLISDYNLPGMNGIELIKQVRQKLGDKVKIILISGYLKNEKSSEDLYKITGANVFLGKPFPLSDLDKIFSEFQGKH